MFKTARAKKLFTAFDLDKDHYLSLSEFNSGLSSLLSSLTLSSLPLNISPTHLTTADGTDRISLTPLQLDALWKETDVDYDGRISLAEFLHRFAGGPDPRAAIVKKADTVTTDAQASGERHVPRSAWTTCVRYWTRCTTGRTRASPPSTSPRSSRSATPY